MKSYDVTIQIRPLWQKSTQYYLLFCWDFFPEGNLNFLWLFLNFGGRGNRSVIVKQEFDSTFVTSSRTVSSALAFSFASTLLASVSSLSFSTFSIISACWAAVCVSTSDCVRCSVMFFCSSSIWPSRYSHRCWKRMLSDWDSSHFVSEISFSRRTNLPWKRKNFQGGQFSPFRLALRVPVYKVQR